MPLVHQLRFDTPAARLQAFAGWLGQLGHRSEIVEIKGAKALDGPDVTWLVHVTTGLEDLGPVLALAGRKVLVVHGLVAARVGRARLAEARERVHGVLATSNTARKALREAGYTAAEVLPWVPDLAAWKSVKADKAVLKSLEGRTHVLALGPLAPAGGIEDAIRAVGHYRRVRNEHARLVVVSEVAGANAYVQGLKELAHSQGVELVLATQPTAAARKAYGQGSAIALHLGAQATLDGPMLEVMALDKAVLAVRTGEAEETLAGAGILLDGAEPDAVGELIDELLTNGELHHQLIERQRRRLAELRKPEPTRVLARVLGEAEDLIQVDGPFETSYSLAIVNRQMAEALARRGQGVRYGGTDGYGDYAPKASDLADKPSSKALYGAGRDELYPRFAVRNMYPPRVADMTGMWNFMGQWGWEETRVPKRFVEPFNRYLDGMGVISRFVKEALEASGVTIPIAVIPNGVTLPEGYDTLEPASIPSAKPIKFLHVSSAFPRKGVDVLIRGYFEAFTGDDPVTLVLKTFPNPHNQVEELLGAARKHHPNPPEVVWINRDMPEREVYALYKAASCLVHTARGEGFGLPVAEAMLARVPVIVSPNTGMADFCTPETATLVGYDWVAAQTHLSEPGSQWAEPRVDELVAALKAFAFQPETLEVEAKVEAAHRLIATEFNWDRVAEHWEAFFAETVARPRKPKVAVVSTWASRCGIAEYSKFLADDAADRLDFAIYANEGGDRPESDPAYPVSPVWLHYRTGDMIKLAERLVASDEDVVHIQYHFGFFSVSELGALVERVSAAKPVVVTFHTTKDVQVDGRTVSLAQIKSQLAKAAMLIVHQQDDLDRLTGFGLQARIVPQGNVTYPAVPAAQVREQLGLAARSPVVATFGFLMPHKGVKELIQAMALLKAEHPQILLIASCAIHTNLASHEHYGECLSEIKRLGLDANVTLVPDFLAPEESMMLLQSADVTVLPYHYTQESSSAAVRFCLAAGRPLVTSKQRIFDEVAPCSVQIDEPTPEAIAQALRTLWADPALAESLVEKTLERVEATSWKRVGAIYAALIEDLVSPKREARIPEAKGLVHS